MMCVARKKERKKYCINQNCQTVPVPIESLGVSCCKERTMHERKWRPVGNLEGTTTRRRRRRSWVTDMAWPFCYLEATVLAVENWWYAVAQSKPVCCPNSGFCRLDQAIMTWSPTFTPLSCSTVSPIDLESPSPTFYRPSPPALERRRRAPLLSSHIPEASHMRLSSLQEEGSFCTAWKAPKLRPSRHVRLQCWLSTHERN